MHIKDNKHIYIGRFLRIGVCLIIISCVFYMSIPPKENQFEIMNATVGDNVVDVLCIGSSHMGCGLNPAILYRDYGYTSYLIWMGSQTPWQSYCYLKEACKTQSPKLVIQDVYMFRKDGEDQDYQTVENLLNIPISLEKIQALNASVADSKLDILFRFPYIHDEYVHLFESPVKKYYGTPDYSMGYIYNNDIAVEEQGDYALSDAREYTKSHPISQKNEEYLKKIIEYCSDNGMELILINAPWPLIDEETQSYYNYIDSVAAANDVAFIDGNKIWDDLGIDWRTDSGGNGGHLNSSGVDKFSAYVGEYIHNWYDVPDRRSDRKYMAYKECLNMLQQENQSR